jgi:carbohydrate binding protein with CBM4/9 domain
MKKATCLFLQLIMSGLCLAGADENLIKNGDFESPKRLGWQKTFNVDSTVAHGGKNALKVEATGKSVFRIKNISKGKRYKVSGWVKCGSAEKAEIRLIRRAKKDNGYVSLGKEIMVGNINGNKKWIYVEQVIENIDADCFDIWLWLPNQKNGVAWFDDLACIETNNTISRNILRNSSFTLCSNPGIPDFWGIPIAMPFAYKDWGENPSYGIDPDVKSPVAGTISLKLKKSINVSTLLLSASYLKLPKGTYTTSVYMKSEQDGTPVIISNAFRNKRKRKKVILTKDWARYSYTAEVAGNVRAVFALPENGIVWFAAPQLIEGSSPGKYSISLFDVSHTKNNSGTISQSFRNTSVVSSFTKSPPKIDGILNDDCWASASQMKDFIKINGESPSAETIGLITADKHCLYIALRCEIPKAGYFLKEKPVVFSEDSIEIFIAPSPDGGRYYHFAGGKSGSKHSALGKNSAWNAEWKFKTSQVEDEWYAEISIPFDSLIKSQAKLPWKINLGRSFPLKLAHEYSCWSHPDGFHNSDKFGTLIGIKPEAIKQPKTSNKRKGLLLSAMMEYPYYMEEDNAKIKVTLKNDKPLSLNIVALKRDNAKNYSLMTTELTKGHNTVEVLSIPISKLPIGTYDILLQAESKKNSGSEIKCELIKLPPKQIDVRINQFTRSLSIKNKPYLATAFHPAGGNSDIAEWQFKELRNHKFNTIIISDRHCKTDNDVKSLFAAIDKCAKNKFGIIFWPTRAWKTKTNWNSYKANLIDTIRRFKGCPGIIAWYIMDEPSIHKFKSLGLKDGEEELKKLYKMLKKEDPYRPFIINWTKNQVNVGREPYGTLACSDLPAMDFYPYNYIMANRMVKYAGFLEIFNNMAAAYGKPVMTWVQNYGYNDSLREPTRDELKCMDFINLIYGTRFIAYYTGKPMSNELWQGTKETHEQLFKVANTVIFAPGSRRLRTGSINNISYSVWENGDKLFVLVVNQLSDNSELIIDLRALSEKSFKVVEGVLEKGNPKIKNNLLNDNLNPMQCQLYRLK